MFGLWPDKDLDPLYARIPGLANLQSLSANCQIPLLFIRLPHVTRLEMHAKEADYIATWSPADDEASLSEYSTNIEEIYLSTDYIMLTNEALNNTHYKTPVLILQHATKLVSLLVSITRSQNTRPYRRGSYRTLIENLSPSIIEVETLVIDVGDMSKQYFYPRGSLDDPDKPRRYVLSLSSMRTLSHFTKLRKIVAAQEALFDAEPWFMACELPQSIEEIGIVNTTRAVHLWANHIRDSLMSIRTSDCPNPVNYLNLKTIKLWVENEKTSHFDISEHLKHLRSLARRHPDDAGWEMTCLMNQLEKLTGIDSGAWS